MSELSPIPQELAPSTAREVVARTVGMAVARITVAGCVSKEYLLNRREDGVEADIETLKTSIEKRDALSTHQGENTVSDMTLSRDENLDSRSERSVRRAARKEYKLQYRQARTKRNMNGGSSGNYDAWKAGEWHGSGRQTLQTPKQFLRVVRATSDESLTFEQKRAAAASARAQTARRKTFSEFTSARRLIKAEKRIVTGQTRNQKQTDELRERLDSRQEALDSIRNKRTKVEDRKVAKKTRIEELQAMKQDARKRRKDRAERNRNGVV